MPGNVVLTCSLAFSYMLIISISVSSVFFHLLFVSFLYKFPYKSHGISSSHVPAL